MKNIKILLLICIVSFTMTSCFKDNDDTIVPASTLEVNDFVWKGMNLFYLYKSEMLDLADNRFSTNDEYSNYLSGFESPETLFESLKYDPTTTDKFSRIFDNYFDLQNQQSGTTLNNGMEFNLYVLPGSETELFGAITLILNNSIADNLGLQRGQIFRAVDGVNLTLDNRVELLSQDAYTLNFANYVNNGTPQSGDDTVTLNGESADLSRVAYTENPVHIAQVLNVNSTNIGYLMYNAFNSNFDSALNDAFGQFKAAGISELVIDLRYNGGGSVQTAAYLGSMVTGQYTGDVYSKLFYNETLSNNNQNFLFTNTIENVGGINSVNLSKVYVLTTNRRTASASELVINSLRSYIEVVVIGENTVGKTQASRPVYDSPDFSFDNVNLGHRYVMQPLIANSTNLNDELVPSDGIIPDVLLRETPSTLGTLGDVNEPLLAAALADMSLADRSLNIESDVFRIREVSFPIPTLEQDMYIDK